MHYNAVNRSGMKFPFGKSFVGIAVCVLAPLLLGGNFSSRAQRSMSVRQVRAAKGPISLAFVTNNPSDYWTICHKGVDKAASELPGVNVQFIMPDNGSAATQITDVGDLIAKGVQGIAICPVDPTDETPQIDRWCAETRVIMADSDAPASKRLCFIGTNNYAAGVMAGDLIKKAIPQGGQIMLFVGTTQAQNARERIQGIHDGLRGSNIRVLGTLSDNTDHAAAQTNVANTLTKYPHIAGLVGIWSYNGPAIATAVKNAGKVGNVKIICFDSDPGTREGIASGIIYGSVVQQPYVFGYRSIKLLAQLVRGDNTGLPTSGKIFIPTLAITRANVKHYEAEQNKLLGGS
jgi:ribose transport system substrate-binding protein